MRPILALAVVAAAGCAGHPASVPVQASAGEVAALAGRWEGEYSSTETGRGGSIVFTLTAGRDSAQGDVLMIPAGSRQAVVSALPGGPPFTQAGPTPAVLTIRFVRLEQGHVSGTLDPYRAPDCDCVVSTTFVGTLAGERITGTYTTRGVPRDAPVTGRWEVRRRR